MSAWKEYDNAKRAGDMEAAEQSWQDYARECRMEAGDDDYYDNEEDEDEEA